MAFCGGCGKKATIDDKFCRGCGKLIVEKTVTVTEENAEIIKEEYRLSSEHTKESGGTHIGDQQKSGEWLESTVEHILKYAGFNTKRNESFVFNEATGDEFRIDVLAVDAQNEIFVECKDYKDIKISEKIMYTLTGQLDDYRKHQSKKVTGILAITAKDDGRNRGVNETLSKHDSFLWDGSMIEHLKNKMTEIGNKEEFRSYVLHRLELFDSPEPKKDGDSEFLMKFSCCTISPDDYVGKSFDSSNFIDDINQKLDSSGVSIINHKSEPIRQGGAIHGLKLTLTFSFSMNWSEIKSFGDKHKKLTDRIKMKLGKYNEYYIVTREYEERIADTLKNIYGIRYSKKSKEWFNHIWFEGSRII